MTAPVGLGPAMHALQVEFVGAPFDGGTTPLGQIIDAAVKVFAKKGFYNAKVSEIAREANVADGTIYLYFKNMDDLLMRLFEDKMQWVIARFREGTLEETDARARFAKIIRMHLAEFQANPDLAAVFQVELRQSSRFMREHDKLQLKGYLDLILMGASGPFNKKQGSFLEIAKANAERLHVLVSDLLDLSRIESGRADLDLQVVSV